MNKSNINDKSQIGMSAYKGQRGFDRKKYEEGWERIFEKKKKGLIINNK